ncbi:aldo/keto reductase [Nocardia sp. NPDC051990]|uniref:aldo/keto reductase n=1 Tax=Nocardia sp. NPDC051990 TaxID=3155285 RepID=UPI00343FC9AA
MPEVAAADSVEVRDSLVPATEYTTLRRPGNPNSGGAHRKSLHGSVEASLRQLNADYIDLLYRQVWDFTTSVEEILCGMDNLVQQGQDPVCGDLQRPGLADVEHAGNRRPGGWSV